MNLNLHQNAGKKFDRITRAYISNYNNTFNYITTCASATVFFTIAFTISFKTTNTMCGTVSSKHLQNLEQLIDSFLQLHHLVAHCNCWQLHTAVGFNIMKN